MNKVEKIREEKSESIFSAKIKLSKRNIKLWFKDAFGNSIILVGESHKRLVVNYFSFINKDAHDDEY